MAAAELAFFKTALATFAKSAAKFDVVCSVRGGSPSSTSSTSGTGAAPLARPARPRSQVHTLVVLDSSFNPPTVAHMHMATSAVADLQRQHPAAMRLLLLLSVNNADKAPKPAAFEQRLALMLAMAKDMQAAPASPSPSPSPSAPMDVPIDIGLTSEPFFHSKSAAIAESAFYTQPDSAAAPDATPSPGQVFLVGYDTLIRIFDPKYYKAESPVPATGLPPGLPPNATPMQAALAPLMRRARLRVTTRPDDQWGDAETQQRWLQTIGARGGATEDWARRIDLLPGACNGGQAVVSSTAARAAARQQAWDRLAAQVGPSVAAWVELQRLYGDI